MSSEPRTINRLLKIFDINIPGAQAAGEPTYTFTTQPPADCLVTRLVASASVADGTDGFVATVTDGSNTIFSAAVAANSVPTVDVDPAANVSNYFSTEDTITCTVDLSGATTSENVDNIHVEVWAVAKPHG